ncbi:uncharacterized protein LOC132698445 [Cylas formicarius]|uniref:uncharacterized protein LOC132697702 n=1 Tax=Cylas formicarius TaxID=197179 RepID=UPI0029589964|nr:uncharacterized protein LOC132697702 [Cylas formicarius]XP_060520182.1 uncharacterized protein LOC132698239 [Cylas formicarius]XP_060520296.1 uncharacterized protein LOC132698318 [Cylas formicarius]XP_060520322.1 uncharacterized protein LOC132698338 [Cylas formicarius]XP_060520478.1 uncharacterized protein LOC132698445 [Cylas formicarius]
MIVFRSRVLERMAFLGERRRQEMERMPGPPPLIPIQEIPNFQDVISIGSSEETAEFPHHGGEVRPGSPSSGSSTVSYIFELPPPLDPEESLDSGYGHEHI